MSSLAGLKIAVVGAGISGLTAARRLEEDQCQVVLFDQSDRIGGRVATDHQKNYPLDHGFQVLLTAYPEARKKLNYEQLQLRLFKPGARVFTSGKSHRIGDPLRDLDFLFSTWTFPHATFRDKWAVLQLNRALKTKSIEEIFTSPETTTLDYLQSKGFSGRIIEHFFRPFFGGIFLESELRTSSRMFEFVFKMFGDGHAAIPKQGIEEIPKQLQEGLKKTELRLKARIFKQEDKTLFWEDAQGESHQESFDAIVLAGTALKESSNDLDQTVSWNSCQNFYLEFLRGELEEQLIGLIAEPNALINNIHLVPSLDGEPSTVISVTTLRATTEDSEVQAEAIRDELRKICGIESGQLLAHYRIDRALPVIEELRHELPSSDYQKGDVLFVAGDYLLYPSLNAAMYSGERAAQECLRRLSSLDSLR